MKKSAPALVKRSKGWRGDWWDRTRVPDSFGEDDRVARRLGFGAVDFRRRPRALQAQDFVEFGLNFGVIQPLAARQDLLHIDGFGIDVGNLGRGLRLDAQQ